MKRNVNILMLLICLFILSAQTLWAQVPILSNSDLPPATRMHFRGFATNSTSIGYSPELALYQEPSLQPSDITFPSITDTALRMRWTPGDGDGTIVIMREGMSVDDNLIEDGAEYRASSAFGSGDDLGSGNYIVFKGTGNAAEVTGLQPGTAYALAFYAYAGSGSDINYLQKEPATELMITSLWSVVGKVFSITIYSPFTSTNVSTLTFFDDGFLQFSSFRGFGVYTAVGNFFWGSYWTPNFEGNDLLIVFTGVTFGSYLSATGVSTFNTNLNSSLWFFLGHES